MRNKKTNKKRIGIMVAAVIVVIIAAGWFGGVKAIVNGRPIWRWQYVKNMERQVGEQTLDQMVTEELIRSEARKEKVVIDSQLVDQEIDKIKQQVEAQGMTLEEALKNEGMSLNDLKEQIRLQKLVEKMAGSGEEATEEQIAEFLETYKEQLPEGYSKEELNDLAKEQLTSQAENEAIDNWLAGLKEKAQIIKR